MNSTLELKKHYHIQGEDSNHGFKYRPILSYIGNIIY